MTSTLADEHCVRVTRSSKRVPESEREALLLQVPEWSVATREGIERLERVFKFANFAAALDFTNRIGALAEAEDHHPAILTEWGRVTIGWWTHVVGGLHRNDFVMAAQSDRVQPAAS
jgi:4a-hydroxytetrahydrobiopterin dehydratase